MADTSLIFSIIARDKTTGVLKKIQVSAMSTGKLAATALGPAFAPVVGVGTTALLGFGGALVAAGASAGVFGAVLGASITEVKETATKYQDLRDKIALYGEQARTAAAHGLDSEKYLKKQADAAHELRSRLALLPPETRKATESFMDMKSDWQDFVEANQPATFSTLSNGYKLIGQVVLKLQPFFDQGKAAADRLLASLSKMVAGGGIDRLAKQSGPALTNLTTIIMNVGRALTGMFGKFMPQGQGMLVWLANVTGKWAAWATATNSGTGINKLVDYVSTNGPKVVALLSSLASAAKNIAQATMPLAPISLAVAGALASLVAAVPPEWITAMVAGWIAYNIALKAYAIGSAIATVATKAFGLAMRMTPMGMVITGITLIVAGIVLLATKTKFFQTIWKHVWGFMKAVGAWFAGPFANFFVMLGQKIGAQFNKIKSIAMFVVNGLVAYFRFLWNFYSKIFTWIIQKAGQLINFFRTMPGKIKGALGNLFAPLWNGFRGFVNRIISGWNNLSFTVGGGSFMGVNIPKVTINTPNLPHLAKGAGSVLSSGLAMIHRGEEVVPARVTPFRTADGTRGGVTITLKSDGTRMARLLLELLREAIREQGGDPVKILTPR